MFKKMKLLIVVVALVPTFSFGNSCLTYYQRHDNAASRLNYKNADLDSLGANAASNLAILDLTPTEINLAKKRLNETEPAAAKLVEEELKTFEQAIERLRIPNEKVAAWSKKLVEAKFIFGRYHQSIWLTALAGQIRLSHQISAGQTVKAIDRNVLESLASAFSKTSSGGDLTFKNGQIEIQNRIVESALNGWPDLSGIEKSVRYGYYTKDYPALPMSQRDFFGVMNTLSEIWESPKGQDFIKLLIAKSTDGVYSIVRSQNKSISNRVVPFLALNIPAALAAVSLNQVGPTPLAVISGVVGVFSTLVGVGFAADGIDSTKFYHAGSLPQRWLLRRRLVKEISNELKANDEAIVAEKMRETPVDQNDSRIVFSMIRDELQTDLLANPVALSLWGQRFGKGMSTLMARQDELESRFSQLVGNPDALLIELQKGKVDQKSIRAKEVLNQISRESLGKLLGELEATKIDLLALSIALDGYLKYIESVRTMPAMSTSNLSRIVEMKLNLFKQNQSLLASLSTKTRQLNDMAVQTMGLIFELDQMILSDGLIK